MNIAEEDLKKAFDKAITEGLVKYDRPLDVKSAAAEEFDKQIEQAANDPEYETVTASARIILNAADLLDVVPLKVAENAVRVIKLSAQNILAVAGERFGECRDYKTVEPF